MEQKEIIDGNKLIAEFHGRGKVSGYGVTSALYGTNHYPLSKIKYHTSWDWLMPVVENIDTNYANVRIHPKICSITHRFMKQREIANQQGIEFDDVPPIAECNISTFIGNVWQAVIDFIKWYNANK